MHVHVMPTLKRHMAPLPLISQETLGTFIFKNIQRQDGNENVNTKTCFTLFCAFLLSFLHYYDVKMPNFAFYGERKKMNDEISFSAKTWISGSLGIHLQLRSPTFDKVSR